MNGQKVLVLGASGLIGSAVAMELAGDNEVHGLSRFRDEAIAARLEERGIKLIRMDAAKSNFDELSGDYDYVFNEILMPPGECDKRPSEAFETHAFTNANILRRFRNCKGIVLGSTGSVYRPSDVPATEDAPLGRNVTESLENYVLSKICGDQFAEYFSKVYNIPVAILRYYQPYTDNPRRPSYSGYIRAITQGEPISASHTLINPMFISDVAELTVKAAEVCSSPANIINVGGEEIVSLEQLATMIGEALGKAPVFKPSSDKASESWICDSSKRIQLLGREKVSLREGMERIVSGI
ncbi:MAG: NAD(P)-dependent oxidoreductase [Armatimonadota bacterium]|nr:NAD(P)-dependent oxidoreductase [Armatimonadota bacterium]